MHTLAGWMHRGMIVTSWLVLAGVLVWVLSGCTPAQPEGIYRYHPRHGTINYDIPWSRHVPPLSQWPSCDPDQVCV